MTKKSTGAGIKHMPNQRLANELPKPINRNFFEKKVYSSFKDNICSVDLANLQLISKYNGENIVGTFYEKEFQKTNQKVFGIEKVIKKKENRYMTNGKNMIIH